MTNTVSGRTYKPRVSAPERRRQLVEAALQVMRRDGITAATTRAICAEADVPLGTFHYCFDSKHDLYASILAEEVDLISSGRAWPVVTAHDGPEEAIRRYLIAYWEQIEADPEAQLVLFELAILVQRDPDLRHATSTERASSAKALEICERLEKEAAFEFAGDRRAIADLTAAALDGLVASWLRHRDGHRARDTLITFASVLASKTCPIGGTR